jgi:hypothetical protein
LGDPGMNASQLSGGRKPESDGKSANQPPKPICARVREWPTLSDDLVDPLGLVHVLELVLPQVSQRHVRDRVVAEQLACCLRCEHLAAVPCCGDAAAAVDTEPHVRLAAHRRLTRVNAHAQELRALRPLMRCQPALTGDRSQKGIFRTSEGDEERVALRVDLVATVLGKGFPQDPLVICERLAVALSSTLLDQLCRALDVGEEEGDGADRQLAYGVHAHSRITAYRRR